jgi:uncharacterized repeat protein (TIGR03803 family)
MAVTSFATGIVQAQTYKVIYNFQGQTGANPSAGVTVDRGGNLYGTTQSGNMGNGVVFQSKHTGSSWVFNPLYEFQGGDDGMAPIAGVIFGLDGSLYGTTIMGGGSGCNGFGCGTVFSLRPPPTACKTSLCPWNETVIHRFSGASDGAGPYSGVIFDGAGNLYGTTSGGGLTCGLVGCGVVYEISPSQGTWTETVLYSFTGGADGEGPEAGVVFDSSGSLYGTTTFSDTGNGTAFQLAPSGSGWTKKILHSFGGVNDGIQPMGGLIFDQSGNLYGTTSRGGTSYGGAVFGLTPSNGGWAYAVLYSLYGCDGCGPHAGLVMDSAGNLYGTAPEEGAYNHGSVFKLTPSSGGWTFASLHDFKGGSDGDLPIGGLVFDADGNLYGTTSGGGAYGYGVVFEITQ